MSRLFIVNNSNNDKNSSRSMTCRLIRRRRRSRWSTKEHIGRTLRSRPIGPYEVVYDVLHYLVSGKVNRTSEVEKEEEGDGYE